jgi:hypothetical protein
MSAFVCQPETFSTIYSGMKVYGSSQSINFYAVKKITERMTVDTAEHLIKRLYSLNVQAVNQRYGEYRVDWMGDTAFRIYRAFNPSVSKYQFLKSLECLHYQMCEGDIPQTREYKALGELIDAMGQSYTAVPNTKRRDGASPCQALRYTPWRGIG